MKRCNSWLRPLIAVTLLASTCASQAESGIIEQEGVIRLVAT